MHHTDDNGQTLLMLAAKKGFARAVDQLVAQDSDLYATTRDGETLLHFAVMGHLCKHVRGWLSQAHDFDVNAKVRATNYVRLSGTPLLYAALGVDAEMFQILVNHGADMAAKDDNGLGVLHYAVHGSHRYMDEPKISECYRFFDCILQKYKELDIDEECCDGKTPLFMATFNGDEHTIAALLKHNANPHKQVKLNDGLLDDLGGFSPRVRDLIQEQNGSLTPMQVATGYCDDHRIQKLFNDAIYNRNESSPVESAAKEGNAEIVGVRDKYKTLEQKQERETSVDDAMAKDGNTEVVQTLDKRKGARNNQEREPRPNALATKEGTTETMCVPDKNKTVDQNKKEREASQDALVATDGDTEGIEALEKNESKESNQECRKSSGDLEVKKHHIEVTKTIDKNKINNVKQTRTSKSKGSTHERRKSPGDFEVKKDHVEDTKALDKSKANDTKQKRTRYGTAYRAALRFAMFVKYAYRKASPVLGLTVSLMAMVCPVWFLLLVMQYSQRKSRLRTPSSA